jgi:hypothetical protein
MGLPLYNQRRIATVLGHFSKLIDGAQWSDPEGKDPTQGQVDTTKPPHGIEIRLRSHRNYTPLNGLIAGPEVKMRSLQCPTYIFTTWLYQYGPEVHVAAAQWQTKFKPHPENPRLCLVLSEYVMQSWVTVHNDSNMRHIQWLPIALGMHRIAQESIMWDNLQVPQPTIEAVLGFPDREVAPALFERLTV